METTNVYLMRCNEFFKVGLADNVQRRRNELQTGNPYPIEVVASYPVPKNKAAIVEGFWHGMLESMGIHVRGEWFKITRAITPEMLGDWVELAITGNAEKLLAEAV